MTYQFYELYICACFFFCCCQERSYATSVTENGCKTRIIIYILKNSIFALWRLFLLLKDPFFPSRNVVFKLKLSNLTKSTNFLQMGAKLQYLNSMNQKYAKNVASGRFLNKTSYKPLQNWTNIFFFVCVFFSSSRCNMHFYLSFLL